MTSTEVPAVDAGVRSRILNTLRDAEERHGVEVVFAVEAGSRACGIASPESDYDVRFVYRHPEDWYLSVEEPSRTVIEVRSEDLIDASGWDVRKALRLFRKSNPSLIEWLASETVYIDRGGLLDALRKLAAEHASGAAAMYHYHHMAKSNFREYLLHDRVKLKKYLYVVKPLLACKWISARGRMPVPIDMGTLLDAARDTMDPTAAAAMEHLVERKRAGKDLRDGPRIDSLNRFIETEMATFDVKTKTTGWMASYANASAPAETLNRLFRDTVRRNTNRRGGA